jgi:hypothetical protein
MGEMIVRVLGFDGEKDWRNSTIKGVGVGCRSLSKFICVRFPLLNCSHRIGVRC